MVTSRRCDETSGVNALTSAAYAEEFAEVKELGAQNRATRTADRTAAAVFWQFAPIALWNPLARVCGGIHFRTADVQGAVIGKKVAQWLRKHYFQPLR